MKRLVLLITALTTLTAANAQDAKGFLDQVLAKVKSYDNIAIGFKYTLNNEKQNINQDARGDVTIQGDKYLLNMLGTTRLFDGAKTYTVVPEDEEVTISAHGDGDSGQITPSKMLTFYEKGYRYKMDIAQNVKGRKIQYVKLTPTNKNAGVKDVLLGIDVQTKHIYKLIQTDANGTRYTVTVTHFKPDQPLSKTLFVFNGAKYEKDGYYINRLD
ncbi:MAG: LolA family protein [Marinirhabdus sp.]